MICDPCKIANHERCDDKYEMILSKSKKGKDKVTYRERTGRRYRSCDCQHQVVAPPPLQPAQIT